jgi:cold shock CspA family protein
MELNHLKTYYTIIYIMSSPETPDVSTQPSDGTKSVTFGRVKWFNNKAGYGFVTISKGEHEGEDVFCHHSAIDVSQEQYRYLIQGEYVEFNLCRVNDSNHKWQAGSVHGINNGKLMCETRLDTRENRTQPRDTDEVRRVSRLPNRDDDTQAHYRVRSRGPGPREGDEWMLVRRTRQSSSRHNTNTSPTKEVLRSRQSKAPYRDGDM